MTEEKGRTARLIGLEGGEQERGRGERRGSTGNLDLIKRKRGEIENGETEDGVFNSSKKMQRAPQEKGKESTGVERSWIEEIKNEVKAELREGIKEMKGIMREQGREIRQEMEELKRIMEEREEKWMKEREEMEERIMEMERKIMKMKEEGIGKEEDVGEKGLEKKLKEIDRKLEMRAREERRKNIVIRGTKGKRNEIEKEVKEILKEVGIETEVYCKKIIQDGEEGGVRMTVIGLQGLEQKRKVMMERRRLGEKGIRIDDDLTWKERKMRWKLDDIARQERGNGKRVRVGYGKIQIEGKWWKWDEDEEILRDNESKVWKKKGED